MTKRKRKCFDVYVMRRMAVSNTELFEVEAPADATHDEIEKYVDDQLGGGCEHFCDAAEISVGDSELTVDYEDLFVFEISEGIHFGDVPDLTLVRNDEGKLESGE